MKKTIHVLLASLLFSRFASAETAPVRFDKIRSVSPKGSHFIRTKVKTEYGSGAESPNGIKNLTPEQLREMAGFLMPDPDHPPKDLPPALVDRMKDVLSKVDMHYKRPIAKAEWDRHIKEMQAEFVRRNGVPGAAVKSTEDWEKSIDAMLKGFVTKLGDPHSRYMGREEARQFRESMAGSFVGIGAQVAKVPFGVKLEFVFPGSPAEKAGLSDGDVIVSVDGAATKDQDLETVVGRLRGPAGTRVRLGVTCQKRPVAVVRGSVKIPDIFSKMAAPGTGYVHFSQFSCETRDPSSCVDARLFTKIDELRAQGATKLIIDLRGNPGGLLRVAESIGSEFLRDNDVVAITKRQEELATKAIADGPGRYRDMRLAVIINGRSASASEVLSAALQEHGRAIVVGSVSYGKGSFQAVMETRVPMFKPGSFLATQSDGAIVKITEGGWYTPNDRSVEGVYDPKTEMNIPGSGGVKPDVEVPMTKEEEEAAMKSVMLQLFGRPAGDVKDAALDKAIEVLNRP